MPPAKCAKGEKVNRRSLPVQARMRESARVNNESPSPEQVLDIISQGVEIFAPLVGTIVAVVQNEQGQTVAVTSTGQEVPLDDIGPAYVEGEKIEPDTWVEGVSNTATLGFGLVALILVAAVLR